MAKGGRRLPGKKLERWEVALVKKLISSTKLNDQDILAYFTRPTRSINHARISAIRAGKTQKDVAEATQEDLDAFLKTWPHIVPETGLHLRDDELLVKAREAMLHAVQSYNNPRTYFKSEVFIVLAVIAFTYLLHWHYRKAGVDIRYKRMKDGVEEVLKTKHGADKHWELEACIEDARCPLDHPTKLNLKFLVSIRHEIEHQLTSRIDETISAKLQACCLNFNRALKEIAGVRYGLDADLSFALQFSTIEKEQRDMLLAETDIPANIQAAQTTFEEALTEDEIVDPRYAYRVAYIEQSVNSKGKADRVVEFIKADSDRGERLQILLKETERPKMKPKQIVAEIKKTFPKFSMHAHQLMWQHNDAKNPAKGFGTKLMDGSWYWYPKWLDFVREQVEQQGQKYK